MRPVGILHTIFIWALIHSATSNNEERISNLEEQILAMDRRLEKLENEIITRNDVIRILKLSLAEINDDDSDKTVDISGKGESDNSSGSTEIEVEEKKSDTVSPVTFMEVRRELQGSKVKFSVRYKPDVEEYLIFWQDHVSKQFPRSVNHSDVPLSNGLRETSILVAPPPENVEKSEDSSDDDLIAPVSVRFLHPNGDGVFLLLRNDGGNAVEKDIILPILKVKPDGDLAYNDDEDVTFWVSTPILAQWRSYKPVGRVIEMENFFRSPYTGELLHDSHLNNSQMEQMDVQTLSDHQKWELKIKTSDFKTSGIFVVKTSFNNPLETSLLGGSRCKKIIVVRPSPQEGAYPPGYLEFVRDSWRIYGDDGTLYTICRSIYDECGFTCTVVGDDVTDLTAYSVAEDGSMIRVRDRTGGFTLTQNPMYDPYIRELSVSYPSDLMRGSQRYRCWAENAAGSTVQKDVVMIYSVRGSIVTDESEVEILHVNETLVQLKIVCKVKGIPHPNVTFALDTYSSYDHDIEPDELIVGGEDEITAVKYLTYDPKDPYNLKEKHQPKLSAAACASGLRFPYYDYTVYDIPMPEQIKD